MVASSMMSQMGQSVGKHMAEEAKKSAASVGVKSMMPMIQQMREKLKAAIQSPRFQAVPPEVKQQLRQELAEFSKLGNLMHGGKRGRRTVKRRRSQRKRRSTRRRR